MKSEIYVFCVIVYCFRTVSTVRITPKLGFDSSPGIRSEYQYGGTDLNRYNYQNVNHDPLNSTPVICISNNCNNTGVKTETGVTADVTVHVNTKVEVQSTDVKKKEEVPDIPIVIGTNGVNTQRNYPEHHFEPPQNNFVPSVVSTNYHPQVPVYQQNHQVGKPIFYQPMYNNGLRPTYSGVQNNQRWPQVTWYVRQPGSANFNPLEFKKTYSNSWSPLKFNYVNNPQQNTKTFPKWNLCNLCNPQQDYDSTIRTRSAPPQVDGKLGSLL